MIGSSTERLSRLMDLLRKQFPEVDANETVLAGASQLASNDPSSLVHPYSLQVITRPYRAPLLCRLRFAWFRVGFYLAVLCLVQPLNLCGRHSSGFPGVTMSMRSC